jgi:uncharacterized protein
MPERPPEFTDIDLDDEDEDETAPAPVDAEPADPIDFDDEEDDVDLAEGEAADADQDGGALEGGAPRAAAPGPASDEDEDVDEEAQRDGIQRAAAVLKYIVENIVDEPGQIAIGATTDDRGPVLLLRVAEDDRGKIIGRQGRIVQAIRTVVKAASIGTGERVSVEIID